MYRITFTALTAAITLLATTASANWGTKAEQISRSPGAVAGITCPAQGRAGTVWGSGIYTADSSVCTAAVHAGFISQSAGGTVQFRMLGGQQSYAGSSSHGVASRNYGAWGLSFQIIGASANAGGTPINWNTTLEQLNVHRNIGSSYSLTCPGGGNLRHSVWGTDMYTTDSSVCAAAVHRGLIGTGGGAVRVRIAQGQQSYVGTRRAGVTSANYGRWASSFFFH